MSIVEIQKQLTCFAEERDWDQFHNPKNLVMALSGEVGELVSLFQWLEPDASADVAKNEKLLCDVKEELADVFIYLIRLADKVGVDLEEAARAKIRLNAEKYPVEKSKGNSRKYTELR